MHFESVRTNSFSSVCHYLEDFVFDEVQQFLIVHHHGKKMCKTNGHFKLQSSFSIAYENIGRHKVN